MHLTSILLAAVTLPLCATTSVPTVAARGTAADAPAISVGDKVVKGRRLKPFDNHWATPRGRSDAMIRETARFETVGGKRRYVRDQFFPMQQGLEMHTELVLDGKTLETISIQKQIVGLPEGASLGARPVFVRWEFEGTKYTRTTRAAGDPVIDEGELEGPMFNGGGLGLVLATLPLALDYEARLPVAMLLSMADDLTFYSVHLRVVGQESFPRAKGRDAEAWIVEVDWLDPESGEITSRGGVDAPGGAYFVLTNPPKGFPHVARYVNDSVLIELVLE